MQYSTTSVESWTLQDFGAALSDNANFKNFITVPKFQRSLVWNTQQKLGLIDSLYRGFPIGAILAYQTPEKRGNRNVLQVVDGLQRITTISDYLKSPLEYVSPDEIFATEFLSEVAYILRGPNGDDEDARNSSLDAISSWLRQVKQTKMSQGWNFESFRAALAKGDANVSEKLDQISATVYEQLTDAHERILQMNATTVPVLVYSGDVSNIPLIFERINNQGIPLSKYEILASGWVDSRTRITNEAIRKAIQEKYSLVFSQGFEIEGYSATADIPFDEFNLYEYLFGLGKVLTDQFPLLFGDSDRADVITPIAFVLVTVAQKLKIAQMPQLATALPKDSQGILDLSELESAIFESAKRIETALKPFLSLKLNSTGTGSLIPHSQNQILSLIASYLANAFEYRTWKPKPSPAADDLLQNCAAHYLVDIVRNSWRGSGDSRLYSVTWQENGSPATHYSQQISTSVMADALRSWHEELLGKKQLKRPNVPMSLKAVLLFVYANKVSVFDDAAVQFELEHIYPVAFLSEQIETSPEAAEGWPISALGNIMIIPKQLNRIKSRNLLGDFLPAGIESGQISGAEVEKTQLYLIHPNWRDVSKSGGLDKDKYLSFCRARMDVLASEIIQVLKLN